MNSKWFYCWTFYEPLGCHKQPENGFLFYFSRICFGKVLIYIIVRKIYIFIFINFFEPQRIFIALKVLMYVKVFFENVEMEKCANCLYPICFNVDDFFC